MDLLVNIFSLAILVSLCVVMVLSCISDIQYMRIPNIHSAYIGAAFFLMYALSPQDFYPWWSSALAFVIMFFITFILYILKVMGSGDTKFSSVLALWIGLKGLGVYIFFMALTGGILGVLALIIRHFNFFRKEANPESWRAKVYDGKGTVPYGVAIACGAWVAIFHTQLLQNKFLALVQSFSS